MAMCAPSAWLGQVPSSTSRGGEGRPGVKTWLSKKEVGVSKQAHFTAINLEVE
jgi:hypothetical protein